ncbi:hypothetical protein FKW77_001677 [Venturia effusa]|uniref:Uncharacterized protein n=1 Tax=Venturia effusa TaxID=50376 RepID=A0A517LRF4_9PEZI|nr:hypothetical protein FKW77_001677 [Venturia effusa]
MPDVEEGAGSEGVPDVEGGAFEREVGEGVEGVLDVEEGAFEEEVDEGVEGVPVVEEGAFEEKVDEGVEGMPDEEYAGSGTSGSWEGEARGQYEDTEQARSAAYIVQMGDEECTSIAQARDQASASASARKRVSAPKEGPNRSKCRECDTTPKEAVNEHLLLHLHDSG